MAGPPMPNISVGMARLLLQVLAKGRAEDVMKATVHGEWNELVLDQLI